MTIQEGLVILIRIINALLWTEAGLMYIRHHDASLYGKLIATVIIPGMWLFVVGGVAAAGFIAGEAVSWSYTVYAGYAAIMALGIVLSDKR